MSSSSIRRTFNKTSMLFVSTFSDTKKCQCTLDVSASVSSPDKSCHQQFASCQVKTVLGTSVRCVQQTRSTAIINGIFTHFYYPPPGSKLAAPGSQKAGTVITTMSTTAFVLTNSTKYQRQAPVAWGTHKYTHSNPIYLGEKDGYLIQLLINYQQASQNCRKQVKKQDIVNFKPGPGL